MWFCIHLHHHSFTNTGTFIPTLPATVTSTFVAMLSPTFAHTSVIPYCDAGPRVDEESKSIR